MTDSNRLPIGSHRFILKNYKAVSEADIRLDGITALVGINGSGKSSIAQKLDTALHVMNNYERYIDRDGVRSLFSLFSRLDRALESTPLLQPISRRNSGYVFHMRGKSFQMAADAYGQIVKEFIEILEQNASSEEARQAIPRMVSLFELHPEDYSLDSEESILEIIEAIRKKLFSELDSKKSAFEKRRLDRSAENFADIFRHRAHPDEDSDMHFQMEFMEDGQRLLLEDEFKMPLTIERSVYLSSAELNNYASLREPKMYADAEDNGELISMLRLKLEGELPSGAEFVIGYIRKVIHGNVALREQRNDFFGPSRQLRYQSDENLDLPLSRAATGIIAFSILLQLLQNGWLTRNTLLILDEPEAHLHPAWVVEYARVLVLLNRYVGTKILVSTHQPDMIAALEAISKREGISDKTNFYIAVQTTESPCRFVFEHLEDGIERIYDSFNASLDSIERYSGDW